MDPTFDTSCLQTIVRQHGEELRRRAEAHARLPRTRRGRTAELGRVRRSVAGALHRLADRIAPVPLAPRPAAR